MVQKLVAASGRSLYLVESSSDEPYGKLRACASSPLFPSLFGHGRPLPRAGWGFSCLCAPALAPRSRHRDAESVGVDGRLVSSVFQALLPLPVLPA